MIKRLILQFSALSPAKIVVLGYLSYALIGWMLLSLPFCQSHPLPALDVFFTSISAMSTTGLATVDLATAYTLLGQIVLLALIQIGGIGYMTFSSFVIVATTKKLSPLRHQVASSALSLPDDFSIQECIYNVMIFTFVCECIGACLLSVLFIDRGVSMPIWHAIFHSVSAFCTAGISLLPDQLMPFRADIGINGVLSLLSLLGAIGYIVWLDVYKKMSKQKKQITFVSQVTLWVTFGFLGVGTVLFLWIQAPASTLLISFFQTMSASTTAGFNTMDIGSLHTASIVLLLFLMVFGASPSGTGGGLKSTTFAALIGLAHSWLLGKESVCFGGREIPPQRVRLATATFAYYTFLLLFSVACLMLVERHAFLPLLFEVASALGTVGLSIGITAELTDWGKMLIALLMLMGRIGLLTFGLAISLRREDLMSSFPPNGNAKEDAAAK